MKAQVFVVWGCREDGSESSWAKGSASSSSAGAWKKTQGKRAFSWKSFSKLGKTLEWVQQGESAAQGGEQPGSKSSTGVSGNLEKQPQPVEQKGGDETGNAPADLSDTGAATSSS